MVFGLEIFDRLFKNTKAPTVNILATIAVISVAIIPLLVSFGWNFIRETAVPIILIFVGLAIAVESGIRKFAVPTGIMGIVNTVLMVVGIVVIITGIAALVSVSIPVWVLSIGAYGALALLIAIVLPN